MENTLSFKDKFWNVIKWLYSKLNIFLYIYLGFVILLILFLLPKAADTSFHMQRFDAVVQEFEYYGLSAFPVRIYHVTCNGYGYASPLFYGDIFMWPFAMLSAVFNIPIIWGYKIMLASVFVAVFFVGKYSFSLITKDKLFWLIFFFYIFNRYIFDNVVNGFVGRAFALMFVPLTICSFIALIKDDKNTIKNSVLIGIGVSGCLFSNAIDAVIAVFSLGVLFVFSIRNITWKKIGLLGLSILVFLFISAWFILPMIEQMGSQTFFYNSENINELNDLGSATVPFLGLFLTSRALRTFLNFFGVDSPYNLYFSGLIFYIVLICVMAYYVLRNRKDIKNCSTTCNKITLNLFLGLFFILVLFSLFQTKLFPHDLLQSIVGVIQFPFRTAIVMAVIGAILIFFICKFSKSRCIIIIMAVVLSLFNVMAIRSSMKSGLEQIFYNNINYSYNSKSISFAEYLPEELMFGTHGESARDLWKAYITERGDKVICSDENVLINSEKSFDAVTLTYSNNTSNATFEMPYFYYKGYVAVDVETGKEYEVSKSENGLVQISGLGESGTVKVYYKGTTIQTVSEIVTGVGVLAIVGSVIYITIKNKRKNNKQGLTDENLVETPCE